MTESVEDQIAGIERRMEQLRARKQRIVARENARARKRRTHLIIQLGGILASDGVLGYSEDAWSDAENRERLLETLRRHGVEMRRWVVEAGIRLPGESRPEEPVELPESALEGNQWHREWPSQEPSPWPGE